MSIGSHADLSALYAEGYITFQFYHSLDFNMHGQESRTFEAKSDSQFQILTLHRISAKNPKYK